MTSTMANPTSASLKTVIGLEVHAQVLSNSKMFCSCSADYANAEPNTHMCMVCLGMPGALPVINKKAIETTIRTGLALNCDIPEHCKMDRKNYFYPDLPKGYQISQYDMPLCLNGEVEITVDGATRMAGITRVHIEEDTGRLVHDVAADEGLSLVDLNRGGVPLMEIVGEPDLTTPEEAREYLIALRRIVRAIGASTGNMEEGAFRCDANISVRAEDGSFVGPKVEIKNLNSFRSVERALKYEEVRQREAVANGEELYQETRGWDDGKGVTISQRRKEQAHDYRYFPEPDLPPLHIARAWVEEIRKSIGELPVDRERRYVNDLGLSVADAANLNAERSIAEYYESALKGNTSGKFPQAVANWLVNDVIGLAKSQGLADDQFPITADQLHDLVQLVESRKLTGTAAKSVLTGMEANETPTAAAERLNLLALEDDGAVLEAAKAALDANPAAVADFKSGKQAAIGRLIGDTMKRTGGRAKPDDVRAALLDLLKQD